MLRFVRSGLITCVCATGVAFAEPETRQLDVHVHGVGQLNLVVDGASLIAELETPLDNILGFEHAPETDEQRQAYQDTLEWLSNPINVFDVSAANCSTVHVRLDQPEHFKDGDHDAQDDHEGEEHADHAHEGHDEHHHDEGHMEHAEDEAHHHANLWVEYKLDCSDLPKLKRISVGIFERFPRFHELEVTYLADAVTTETLKADHATMELRR